MIIRRVDSSVDVDGRAQTNSLPFFNAGTEYGVIDGFIASELEGSLDGRRVASAYGGVRLATLTDYFRRDLVVGYDSGHGCFDGCVCEDRPVSCINGYPNYDVRAMFDGNLAFIGQEGLTPDDILNGVELVCAAARLDAPDPDLGCDGPGPDVRTVRQMLQADSFLRCKAARLEEAAAATVVRDLPEVAVETLRRTGPSVVGGGSGEVAAAARDLGTALVALADARHDLAATLNDVADQVALARSAVALSNLATRIEELQLVSNILSQITTCANALTNVKWDNAGWSGAAAGVVCANSAAQIGLATAINSLGDEAEEERLRSTFIGFDREVSASMQRMNDTATSIRTQLAAIDAALARLQSARSGARHAMARSLFLESDGTDTHFAASSVYRARYNTALFRYRAARQRALTSAFIARRAIEQRLYSVPALLVDSRGRTKCSRIRVGRDPS
jgi:hypothetical protein